MTHLLLALALLTVAPDEVPGDAPPVASTPPPASQCDGFYRSLPDGSDARSHDRFLLACILAAYPKPSDGPVLSVGPLQGMADVGPAADHIASTCARNLARAANSATYAKSDRDMSILAEANRLPTAAHRGWLAGCLRDLATIEPGTRYQALGAFLTTEGGIHTRRLGSYVHCRCKYLKVQIAFELADETSKLWRHPDDLVATVGPVELDLLVTD